MRLLPLLRTAHAWAGAVLSILIAVLGLSGSLLVFKHDYLRIVFPDARESISLEPANLGPVLNRIEREHAAEGLRYVMVGGPDFGLHKAVFTDGSGAYLDARGEIVDRWQKNGRPEEWLFDLHHYLLAGDTGKLVAGVAGGAAVLMALTGLIIVWPSLRMFRARAWPKTARRRDLLAQHRDLGVMFAVPIVLLCFTGFAMVYSGPVKGTLDLLTGSAPADKPGKLEAGTGPADWEAALSAARTAFPAAVPRLASQPAAPGAPVSLRLRQPQEWHQNGRTYLLMDPATGTPLRLTDGLSANRTDSVFNVLYPLHSSGIGGHLYDVLSSLTGLALTALGLVGTWTFLTRPKRRRKTASAAPV